MMNVEEKLVNWAEPAKLSRGTYEVLRALPEGTLSKILEKWHSRKDGYFADLWDDISWEVALELLWNPKTGITNEALAYMVIENALVEAIREQGGINAAFIPHSMPQEYGKLFTVADYQVVYTLSYCLEEVMAQTTFNKIACRLWINKLLASHGISGIDGNHKAFVGLLGEIDSDTSVEEFIQKVIEIGRKKSYVKKYNISVQLPAEVNPYEVLQALAAGGKIKGFIIK